MIEGVEGTGKSTLIKQLKDLYPFTIISPSNYLDNASSMYYGYKLLSHLNTGMLFDRFFISRSAFIEGEEMSFVFNLDWVSDKNRIVLLECDYSTILKRFDKKKLKKFSYKCYEIHDIPKIAEKMRTIYDIFKIKHPEYCLDIDNTNQTKEETLENVLTFLGKGG